MSPAVFFKQSYLEDIFSKLEKYFFLTRKFYFSNLKKDRNATNIDFQSLTK